MKLHWFGHACFMLENGEDTLVFDPYEPGSVPGLALPPLRVDAVLCSHGHRDHGYTEAVELTGRESSFRVSRIHGFHDNAGGRKRGSNTVHIVDADGLRFVHLGDIGHMLSPAELKKLGRVDVLMLPVGGYYTVNADEAFELAKSVGARLTIPMHYRGEGFGYDVIGPVENFTDKFDSVEFSADSVLDTNAMPEASVLVLRCPVRHVADVIVG